MLQEKCKTPPTYANRSPIRFASTHTISLQGSVIWYYRCSTHIQFLYRPASYGITDVKLTHNITKQPSLKISHRISPPIVSETIIKNKVNGKCICYFIVINCCSKQKIEEKL